ncbi:response regulator [Saccharospirillum salsuginis]|uniref:DNA-binding response regulator n=1 Tax=Saccharospirillum salsuginis TaxID=418750 RepID=A0A918KJW3_9GAMM|nr:response regulator [Saccharospirillum salsuginis]GGX66327.1 DNA-binding response regulator [Saccharospirillum salsuginis]
MSANTPVRIVIVDDHPLLRHGIAQLLDLEDDLELTAAYGSGSEAIKRIPELDPPPELILMDVNMPDQSGLRVIEKLRKADVDSRIVVLSVSDDHADIFKAVHAGADGYLLKDLEPDNLLHEIRRAISGEQVVSETIKDVLLSAQDSWVPENVHPRIRELTEREKDVLRLIARGLSNKGIGAELEIAEGTVKVHVKRLLSKLGLKSRVEAAVFALEHDID